MKKLLLVFLFMMMLIPAKASHIVGGEFELIHVNGNTYRLTLILYFDSINGSPRARDISALVRFFRKRDNTPVLLIPNNVSSQTLTLLFDGIQRSVPYSNMECQTGELVTNKLVYTATVTLRNDVFNDPEGYYVAWERCCRNYSINNIYSETQPGPGIHAGQTFYMEFPPVVKNGQPFINNSPRLFPPLSDYACPRIPYFVDFGGIDDDGDSLVYTIVTPLNTFTADAFPPPIQIGQSFLQVPRPGPYRQVNWRPGFGPDNIMNGLTNLEITPDGLLTVTPNSLGLYVFAVKCEEFRGGEKIGEVRRDFQMLVLDRCPIPVPPEIAGKKLNDPVFESPALEVTFDGSESDADRCFEVRVTDPSTLLPDDNFQENIRIRAVALDFKKDVSEILPPVINATISNGGEKIFQICLPRCPYKLTGSFKIGIVAYDDACAVPQTDTLVVTVNLDPPPNAKPEFNNPENGTEITEIVSEGGPLRSWEIQVSDPDDDLIAYRLEAVGGFNLADFGMSFTAPSSDLTDGPVSKTLSWDPKCDVYDFTQKSNFELYFIAEDRNPCSLIHGDTTHFQLSIIIVDEITPPVIDNSILTNADTIDVNVQMKGEPLTFNVFGSDVDNTNILLRGEGIGFNAASYGISFPSNFDQGSVESTFTWELTCDSIDYEESNPFYFQVALIDSLNKCRFYKADTLIVAVTVEPPDVVTFIPPNVFSPNKIDDLNSFFAMAKYDEATEEFINILPEDDCFRKFVSILIYDRWGKQVFESFDRNFRWYGEGMPVGVYYYSLKFSDRDYKGIVSIRF
jgi:hypothetical protein